MELDFLSSGSNILLFRALLKFVKFRGDNLFKEKPYSCSSKLIFWLEEIDFFYFSDTPASESYLLFSGNVFLNEFFIPYGGDGFSVLWKPFFLI